MNYKESEKILTILLSSKRIYDIDLAIYGPNKNQLSIDNPNHEYYIFRLEENGEYLFEITCDFDQGEVPYYGFDRTFSTYIVENEIAIIDLSKPIYYYDFSFKKR